jgi:hypothetical protein
MSQTAGISTGVSAGNFWEVDYQNAMPVLIPAVQKSNHKNKVMETTAVPN